MKTGYSLFNLTVRAEANRPPLGLSSAKFCVIPADALVNQLGCDDSTHLIVNLTPSQCVSAKGESSYPDSADRLMAGTIREKIGMMGPSLQVHSWGHAMSDTACGCRVVYTGRVQGVGFRATAVMLAQEFPISGWVRNLSDGRVELLAEGERQHVEAFLTAIRHYWGPAIHDEQADWRPATGTYRGFRVLR